jgi:hypothetical protein
MSDFINSLKKNAVVIILSAIIAALLLLMIIIGKKLINRNRENKKLIENNAISEQQHITDTAEAVNRAAQAPVIFLKETKEQSEILKEVYRKLLTNLNMQIENITEERNKVMILTNEYNADAFVELERQMETMRIGFTEVFNRFEGEEVHYKDQIEQLNLQITNLQTELNQLKNGSTIVEVTIPPNPDLATTKIIETTPTNTTDPSLPLSTT